MTGTFGDENIVSDTLKDRSNKHGGTKKKGYRGALAYVDKAKYDDVGRDDTDESSDEVDYKKSGKVGYARISERKASQTSLTSADSNPRNTKL